jgi:hypothetical protein
MPTPGEDVCTACEVQQDCDRDIDNVCSCADGVIHELIAERKDPDTGADIRTTLTSFFYDLVKEVPAGVLNRALMNTVIVDAKGDAIPVTYCDDDLAEWAQRFAQQLVDYQTKFTRKQLDAMDRPRTRAINDV